MAYDPFTGDIVRLKGHRFSWRRRVGSYRILYDLDPINRAISVGLIERRTTTTYRQ
jgi:mRNA-degrading endonuclease RelE of RelBE toxin-antitoxin system